MEAAQRRAPFAERKEKKRKHAEEGEAPAPKASASSEAVADTLPALESGQAAAGRAGSGKAAQLKPASTAAGDASPKQPPKKRQRVGSDAAREKQKMVRTVALGNLTPAVRAGAIAYAQTAGKVILSPGC